jgi:hypothetical protein
VVSFANAVAAKDPRADNLNGNNIRGLGASYAYVTGLLTDELSVINDPVIVKAENGFPTSAEAVIDNRNIPYNDPTPTGISRGQYTKDLFAWLQTVRTRSQEARGALLKYAPEQPVALVGHLHALEGYAEVLMAELYCSGIPLSNLIFEGDFQYSRGYSTEEVYQRAIAQFDSALALAADSASIVNFARMGKARALLGLGDYAGAAEAAAAVPTGYQYQLTYASTRTNMFLAGFSTFVAYATTESNSEGGNGLPYWSDPRTEPIIVAAPVSPSSSDLRYQPRKFLPSGALATAIVVNGDSLIKYQNAGTVPVPIATGIEARLIEAEAALHDGGDWLGMLNALRTNGTYTVTGSDTTWHAGSGGVEGLKPLSDPGDERGRVMLVFNERAYWLFLTGYRQGDLRRLVRQYSIPQEQVYPVGLWGPLGATPYGTDTNAPIPYEEQQYNSLYGGCLNRDA